MHPFLIIIVYLKVDSFLDNCDIVVGKKHRESFAGVVPMCVKKNWNKRCTCTCVRSV